MTIDPRIGFWLGVIASLLVASSTGAGAASLTVIFGVAIATKIAAACAYFGFMCTIVVTALHGVPSANTPQAQKAFLFGPKTPVIMLVAFSGLLLFLLASPAQAQAKHEPQAEIARAGGIFGGGSDVSTFLTNLAAIQDAITLSTAIPELQDPVGNACWVQFGPIQALIKDHPLPLTMKVAADVEASRLLAIALNQICRNPNCSAMWQDASNVAGAISGVPIPVTLASICAKIPVISTNAAPTSNTLAPVVGTTPAPTPMMAPK